MRSGRILQKIDRFLSAKRVFKQSDDLPVSTGDCDLNERLIAHCNPDSL